ncbi:bifunctional DNA-formamidopyrimidine glycosylase/DNA-(apurinic or apyrimidinic site) lyase [Ilumatobacter sp.]|uniref:bifunctional DNA-formamidopyrimidine glycosylase/DNA-(apurinic or apyrimidinic site) lyase n=1 Tax=Ilumatobacter sp. TaxID=1967498 RepID=UPI003B51C060
MPELPEVETVRRGLARHVVGRRIDDVEVGRDRVVRRTSRDALVHGLRGATVTDADRRGKYLLLGLDTGDAVMIHLRMSGQVLLASSGSERPLHTHVVMHLDDGRELRFVDPRTFGEVVVYDPARIDVELPGVARLGVDPVAEPFERAHLRRIVRGTRRALKPLLLDQHVIAGIGNIYGDEILHRARLRPHRAASSIDAAATWRLHAAVVDVLSDAIDAGGSTLGDAQYVDVAGAGGSYQHEHRVYGRTGERCSTCGRGWIRRIVSAGRSTHFCPWCQR